MKTQQEQFIYISDVGIKLYFKDKEMKIRHRLDGPAVEGFGGNGYWYVDGKLHRLDGPAVKWSDGHKEWWINDESLTESEFIALTAPKPVEITFDQIAEKFGIGVEQVKLVK